MKIFLPTLFLTAACLLSNIHADLTIVQKVEGVGPDVESTTKIKPGEVRIDAAPATSIIMDQKTGEIISLMPGEKKYMKIPGQLAQAAIDSFSKSQGGKAEAMALTSTGKKDTIDGYACEEYICSVGGSKGSLWLTKALPDYQAALKEMETAFNQGPMSTMMKNLSVDFGILPGFPMKTVSEVRPGQTASTSGQPAKLPVVITSTVVSVSTAAIPDADFAVPAEYTEMKIPSLTPPAVGEAPALSK